MATIGPSSPYAPWFISVRPKRVPSMPLSLRIGSSVPSAVEVRAIATAISAWMWSESPIRPITASATPRHTSQVASARRPPLPTSSSTSTS